MNSISLIVLTVLVLTFGTLQAFPQHGVDLESGAMGGGADSGAGVLDGSTGARAGAFGGASRSGGTGSLRGPGGLISVSSGSYGGMALARAGANAGAAGASVQAQGGGAGSDGVARGADGRSTNIGSGASGGASQAAADTVGDVERASSGAVGGSADSGAELLGEDGGSTNVGTGASGGVAEGGVVKAGEVASVHTGSIGGGADSAAGVASANSRPAELPSVEVDEPVAGPPTPTEAEPSVTLIEEPVDDEELKPTATGLEDKVFVIGAAPAAGLLTAEPVETVDLAIEAAPEPADTPAVAVIEIPNGDESPIELIVPLPADNPEEEVKDAEDSETPPGQRRSFGLLKVAEKIPGAIGKGLESFVDALTKKSEVAPEAAPVNSEADV